MAVSASGDSLTPQNEVELDADRSATVDCDSPSAETEAIREGEQRKLETHDAISGAIQEHAERHLVEARLERLGDLYLERDPRKYFSTAVDIYLRVGARAKVGTATEWYFEHCKGADNFYDRCRDAFRAAGSVDGLRKLADYTLDRRDEQNPRKDQLTDIRRVHEALDLYLEINALDGLEWAGDICIEQADLVAGPIGAEQRRVWLAVNVTSRRLEDYRPTYPAPYDMRQSFPFDLPTNQRAALLTKGDQLLAQGGLLNAIEAKNCFLKAQDAARLSSLGERYEQDGSFGNAVEIACLLGDTQRVEALADKYLAGLTRDVLRMAQSAYAGCRPAREKLTRLGDRFVRAGLLREALETYGAAQDQTKLLTLAETFLVGKDYPHALKALAAAGATERLRELGRNFVTDGKLAQGRDAFAAADDMDGFAAVGDEFAEQGKFYIALEIYLTVRDRKRLREIGDRFASMGPSEYSYARRAYENAEAHERLLELGDRYRGKPDAYEAIRVYRAGEGIDRLIEFGDELVSQGVLHDALSAYDDALELVTSSQSSRAKSE